MLDLRRLRVLHELSRRGTLAATARALAYTPSAVSQQLSTLEREAGVVLLERHGRGVVLTAAAHALVRRTQAILDELDAAEADLQRLVGRVAGTVRVAAFPTAIAAIVVPAAHALRQAAPNVDVHVREEDPPDALESLRTGAADVAVAYDYDALTPLPEDGMERRHLLTDPVCAALPPKHRLALASRVELGALRDEPWIAGLAGTTFGALVHQVCRLAGYEPQIVHRAREFATQESLVAAGLGVALLPHLGRRDAGGAAFLTLRPTVTRRVDTLVRRGAAERPAVRALLRELENAAARPAAA